ncbi:MAG: tetratricopeptide repeat protein [Deltaproteobacteria bacterium]|nr:tetratricopeptide repeat protein [Deltaproteobacteria bacterium]MBW2071840.1 tetratricopeptide repeat protein [Deltaproteobacteria bacterium]
MKIFAEATIVLTNFSYILTLAHTTSMTDIELYREMLQKDPTSRVFVFLAEALLEKEKYREAIEVCQSGLRVHPHDLRARVIMGLSYLRAGDIDQAEAELLRAKEILDSNITTYEALAEVYEHKGLQNQASYYQQVVRILQLSPEEPLESSGVLGETEEAPVAVPDDTEVATITMAELYSQQGHLEKAAAVYRQILATSPQKKDIQERLAALQQRIASQAKGRKLLQLLEKLGRTMEERPTKSPAVTSEDLTVDFDREKLADIVSKMYRARTRP